MIHDDHGLITVECDLCKVRQIVSQASYYDFFEAMKSQGWRFERSGTNHLATCPECPLPHDATCR